MSYLKLLVSIVCGFFATLAIFSVLIINSAYAEIEESFDVCCFVNAVSDKPKSSDINDSSNSTTLAESVEYDAVSTDAATTEDSETLSYTENVDDYVEEVIPPEFQESSEPSYTFYEDSSYVDSSYSTDPSDFQNSGVVYDDYGTRYTWYSQNVLPGGGLDDLNSNGRHVDENGYVCDGDGYIAVASSDYEMGTIVDTPFGEAKVYDTGCPSGTIDVYTDF